MKKLFLMSCAMLALAGSAHAELLFHVPADVSAGHLNVRTGPGVNHGLVGAIPADQTVWAERCVPRDDGLRGADWCLVEWNTVRGWASRVGLMPIQPEAPIPDPDSGHGLICSTPRVAVGNDYDPNPVVSVEVQHYVDDHSWRIFHTRSNGQVVSRSEQYAITDWSDQYHSRWTGSFNRNRNLRMIGEVKQDKATGQVYYIEQLYDGNRLDMESGSPCRLKTAEEDAAPFPPMTPVPVSPTPQPLWGKL